jgi:hypothetical protein
MWGGPGGRPYTKRDGEFTSQSRLHIANLLPSLFITHAADCGTSRVSGALRVAVCAVARITANPSARLLPTQRCASLSDHKRSRIPRENRSLSILDTASVERRLRFGARSIHFQVAGNCRRGGYNKSFFVLDQGIPRFTCPSPTSFSPLISRRPGAVPHEVVVPARAGKN